MNHASTRLSALSLFILLMWVPVQAQSVSNAGRCLRRELVAGTTMQEQASGLLDIAPGWEQSRKDVYIKRAGRGGACSVKFNGRVLLRNLDRVSTNVYRGSQPFIRPASSPTSEDGFTLLKAAGITDVIDLRETKDANESASDRVRVEERRADEEKLKFYAVELPSLDFGLPLLHQNFSSHAPEVARVVRLIKTLEADGNRKIYLHCSHGADRTGVVVAMLRLLDGAPLETVLSEVDDHSFSRFQRGMRRFIKDTAKPERLAEFRRLVEQSQPALL